MPAIFSLSAISAGFVAVLVGYSSAAIIIFQAAAALGASDAQISSWLWALGMGMGLSSLGLSLYYRQPVLTAWSTPGAALLISSLAGVSMSDAIGAFLLSSLLITLCGITGWFETLMSRLPKSLAAAMLAGVLFQFGLKLFQSLSINPVLVAVMLVAFVLLRIWSPRYVIPSVLLLGISISLFQGQLHLDLVNWQFTTPVWVTPSFSLTSIIGVALPLFMVTMASQNIPGLATLRANGFDAPASPLITWTGITGVLLAPFGGFAFNLAAITAAICMGNEAHPDRKLRYLASSWAGAFYIITGLFGATVVSLFAAFPAALTATIAGLALLGTIGSALNAALQDKQEADAALITLLVTASGVSIGGVGSAFWGLIIGLGVYFIKRKAED